MSIGGWGGWSYAVGSSMVLKNAVGETIKTYCILDSDYHTKEEIENKYNEAAQRGVELHIWTQKEIENFLIVSTVVHRLIRKRMSARTTRPTTGKIESQIDKMASEMLDDVFDGISTEILSRNRKLGQGRANKEARVIIKEEKDKKGSILALVSGKTLISKLSKWSQDEFGVSFNAATLAKEFMTNEIPREVVTLVEAMEHGNHFNNQIRISESITSALT